MNIVFACGGTGGHLIPALAIAEVAREQGANPIFIGTGKVLESELVGEAGFPLENLGAKAVVGGGATGFIKFLIHLPLALLGCISLYRKIRPDVVVGMGGYPSFVPMLTAFLLRIPSLLSEQNVQVGLANKALSLLVDRIVAVEGAKGFWSRRSVEYLSNPVREVFSSIKDWQMPSDGIVNLLVLGGSQGAVSLNRSLIEILDELGELPIRIVHQSGKKSFEETLASYEATRIDSTVEVFIENVAEQYEWAHLIICRAGAMTVAEVAASSRPAIFVPLPIAGAHQAENCRYLVDIGAATMIKQDDSTSKLLLESIRNLVLNPSKLEQIALKLAALRSGKSSAVKYWELIRGLSKA